LGRVLVEKLIVTQLSNKFAAFYGTIRFVRLFHVPGKKKLPSKGSHFESLEDNGMTELRGLWGKISFPATAETMGCVTSEEHSHKRSVTI
jgi:hypothetical protein